MGSGNLLKKFGATILTVGKFLNEFVWTAASGTPAVATQEVLGF